MVNYGDSALYLTPALASHWVWQSKPVKTGRQWKFWRGWILERSRQVDGLVVTEMEKKPARVKSKNGDLFIVVKDGRQIALGLNARGNHRPGRLGYFFPISYFQQAAKPSDVRLDRQKAIYVKVFSYLKIRDGEWPTIGQLQGFRPEDWPMPKFESTSSDGVTKHISEYDEERLEKCVFYELKSRLPPNYDLSFVITDSLAGADFVAAVLEDMMKSKGLLV